MSVLDSCLLRLRFGKDQLLSAAATPPQKVRTNGKVTWSPVTIYTKDGCSFCTRAKSLLNEEKIEYTECNIDRLKETDPKQYKPRVNGLVYMTKRQCHRYSYVDTSSEGVRI
ncbi:hypothetical protein OSTOST_18169 [Ostertagia ostertagi]